MHTHRIRPLQKGKPTVLVIDRDADVHRFVHAQIGKEFDVHHAYFPRLALSLLKKRRFTLVVASLDMQNRDDEVELRELIKRLARSRETSILNVNSRGADGSRKRARTDYSLCKPLNEESFAEGLRRALNGRAELLVQVG
jgi:PleD family two-component response regulator